MTSASIDAVAPSVLRLLRSSAFLEPSTTGRATADFAVFLEHATLGANETC